MTRQPLGRAFFDRPVVDVARELIGATLLFDGAGGVLVEVEAYDQSDPASHSFRGPTPRNAAMFGPPGEGHEVATGTRIGITKAAEVPWRFVRRGSPFLSKRLAES